MMRKFPPNKPLAMNCNSVLVHCNSTWGQILPHIIYVEVVSILISMRGFSKGKKSLSLAIFSR